MTPAPKHYPPSFGLTSSHDDSRNSNSKIDSSNSGSSSSTMQYHDHTTTLRALSRLRRKNRRELLQIVEIEQDQIVKEQLSRWSPLLNSANKLEKDEEDVDDNDDDIHVAVTPTKPKETTVSVSSRMVVEVEAARSNIIDSTTTSRAPRLIMKRMQSPNTHTVGTRVCFQTTRMKLRSRFVKVLLPTGVGEMRSSR